MAAFVVGIAPRKSQRMEEVNYSTRIADGPHGAKVKHIEWHDSIAKDAAAVGELSGAAVQMLYAQASATVMRRRQSVCLGHLSPTAVQTSM